MPITRPCETCGEPVTRYPSEVARGQGRFCSIVCRNKGRWKEHHSSINEWFWDRVDKSAGPDKCWPWQGHRLPTGYGRLVLHGKFIGAHRVAYELEYNKKPGDLFVCHKCDNPICCNPRHLFLGTHQDNMDDKVQKGRNPSGAQSSRATISEAQAQEILDRVTAGEAGASIARDMNVSEFIVSRIKHRKTWTALKAREVEDAP